MPTKTKFPGGEDHVIRDFQDPTFILQNISYNTSFDPDPVSFSSIARNNMIECMSDQICFLVMCAFRAHHLASSSTTLTSEDRLQIKPPGILVYGSGVVAECVLEALAEMGCAPYIKVFARDVAGAKLWASKGYRSTIEMRDGYQISILLVCCNLVGFSQLCRDLSQYLTAKTFIISNVFNLQRKRMFNLFGTPGIVRTYVERRGASKAPQDDGISTRVFSARQLASKVNGVKNLILILENYMIALDIHKDTARREAIHLVVGSDRISLEERKMNNPYKNKRHITFSDEENSSSDEDFDDDFDSDTSDDSSEYETVEGRAKEADLNLNPVPLTEKETRQALFELRVRSFQVEDAMEEAKRKLQKKEKRKQRRLEQQIQQNKLNHAVHKRIEETQSIPTPPNNNTSSIPSSSSSSLSINTEPPAVTRRPTTAPSPSSSLSTSSQRPGTATGTPSKPTSTGDHSSSSSSVIPPSSYAAINRFNKAYETVGVENFGTKSPSSSRRMSVNQGLSGGKLKRANKVKPSSSGTDGSNNHLQRSPSSSSRRDREEKEKEEQDERELLHEKKDQAWLKDDKGKSKDNNDEDKDKINNNSINQGSSMPLSFLQQMVSAFAEQSNKPDTIPRKSPLLKIIRNIEKRYGEIFRKELSKYITVVDLPTLIHVKQKSPRRKARKTLLNSVLTQRASLARKNTLLSVMPTVVKQQVGYLTEDELLDIFNSDKKSASIISDEQCHLLDKMDEESDEEDKEGKGDDLFIEDVPRDKFRFFVLENEQDVEEKEEQLKQDTSIRSSIPSMESYISNNYSNNTSDTGGNTNNNIQNMSSMEGLQDI